MTSKLVNRQKSNIPANIQHIYFVNVPMNIWQISGIVDKHINDYDKIKISDSTFRELTYNEVGVVIDKMSNKYSFDSYSLNVKIKKL